MAGRAAVHRGGGDDPRGVRPPVRAGARPDPSRTDTPCRASCARAVERGHAGDGERTRPSERHRGARPVGGASTGSVVRGLRRRGGSPASRGHPDRREPRPGGRATGRSPPVRRRATPAVRGLPDRRDGGRAHRRVDGPNLLHPAPVRSDPPTRRAVDGLRRPHQGLGQGHRRHEPRLGFVARLRRTTCGSGRGPCRPRRGGAHERSPLRGRAATSALLMEAVLPRGATRRPWLPTGRPVLTGRGSGGGRLV